ncbi:MAG: Asp-tRNA(Asn)/Glu-tRNA(Gln) amidotransferase subunit GatB [Planctomycetota bacterium]|jgi:aspartyl-tRNA(Asn)/glutamyl-tRNA(Gln) amidotransferase subunit B|nr:Asp-tRNA(Asn)/Glu-tRNA(Gln) amidotransferase subunit GatB [Planctomycetota bacterium]
MSGRKYVTTVGVEVHVELATRTKMFCSCLNAPQGVAPNLATCPVCLGLPGSLPVINREAVRLGIVAALALNCAVNPRIWFERKNYVYPDLVKGYQISQIAMPLGERGWLAIIGDDGAEKKVAINRVHLEEDTARLAHSGDNSLIDVNRSGAPLMEIVTDAVLRSGREAEEYVRKLRAILVYNGVSRCRIQRGEMRVEANVSIAPEGAKELGVRSEIKNQAGFNHMRSAVEYEVRRQAGALDAGGTLRQETRGWDDVNQRTFVQRSKEDAHDYRYFPEPDLPPLNIDPAWVAAVEAALPTGYEDYVAGLLGQGLTAADVDALSRNDALGFLRLAASAMGDKTVLFAKRLIKDVFALANSTGVPLDESRLGPSAFRDAALLLENGKIAAEGFRTLLDVLYREGGEAERRAGENQLFVETDAGAVAEAISKVFAENPRLIEDFKNGKIAVRNALLGRTMKAVGKRADPRVVSGLLDQALQHQGRADHDRDTRLPRGKS